MKTFSLKLQSLFKVFAAIFFVLIISKNLSMSQTKENTSIIINELKAVERTINDVFGWAVKKDFNLFFQTISDDSNFISVTPYNRVKFGIKDVKNDTAFWGSPYFKAIRHELHDLRITFSRSGDVAWFFCILDDINEWKGKPANWENARWTGVLEKRDGKWRIVQQHFSFAKEK
jgi:ketosteroid isomerase-like protein